MTVQEDPVVGPYMQRLEEATETLPADHRAELLAHVREHISVHIGDPSARTDAEKLQTLDQLGTPEEIARAAHEEEFPEGAPAVASKAGTPTTVSPTSGPAGSGNTAAVLTVVLLSVGGFLLLVGWFVGLVMLWHSPRWTTTQRLAGTLLVPGGLLLPVGLMVLGHEGPSTISGVIFVIQSLTCTVCLARATWRTSLSAFSAPTL